MTPSYYLPFCQKEVLDLDVQSTGLVKIVLVSPDRSQASRALPVDIGHHLQKAL